MLYDLKFAIKKNTLSYDFFSFSYLIFFYNTKRMSCEGLYVCKVGFGWFDKELRHAQ
jgi:hypothetical protein